MQTLRAWNGKYTTKYNSTESYTIINAKPNNIEIIFRKEPVKKPQFAKQILEWSENDGNDTNAMIKFTMVEDETTNTPHPQLHGTIWEKGTVKPKVENITGEIVVDDVTPWAGSYKNTVAENDGKTYSNGPELKIQADYYGSTPVVSIGGKPVPSFSFHSPKLTFTDANNQNYELNFYFDVNVEHDNLKYFGFRWPEKEDRPEKENLFGSEDSAGLEPWSGFYTSYKQQGNEFVPGPSISIEGVASNSKSANQVIINGVLMKNVQFNNPVLTWNDARNSYNGDITLYINKDDKTKHFTGIIIFFVSGQDFSSYNELIICFIICNSANA